MSGTYIVIVPFPLVIQLSLLFIEVPLKKTQLSNMQTSKVIEEGTSSVVMLYDIEKSTEPENQEEPTPVAPVESSPVKEHTSPKKQASSPLKQSAKDSPKKESEKAPDMAKKPSSPKKGLYFITRSLRKVLYLFIKMPRLAPDMKKTKLSHPLIPMTKIQSTKARRRKQPHQKRWLKPKEIQVNSLSLIHLLT
jgi:hypothetical protein